MKVGRNDRAAQRPMHASTCATLCEALEARGCAHDPSGLFELAPILAVVHQGLACPRAPPELRDQRGP
eukprot:5566088-Lingulodinium_polyedra.AAC.1